MCLLHAGEVDSARRIAERALSTISMTAERDKFNVWVALMNLEAAYGGEQAEDALMGVFNRYGLRGAVGLEVVGLWFRGYERWY